MSELMKMETNLEKLLQVTTNLVQAYTGMDLRVNQSIKETRELREDVKELLRSTTLNGHERKTLKQSVNHKVSEVAEACGYSNREKRSIYPVIWNVMYQAFDVTAYGDIPREDYKEALRMVRNFSLTRKNIDRINARLEANK